MSPRISITTPENVVVSFELAGVGSRFVACLLDTLLQAALMLAVILAFALLVGTTGRLLTWQPAERALGWVMALMILALFLVFWGYYVAFETLWNGQTPGKRSVRIRVVREGGLPLDFQGAMIRNIVRLADFLPAFYGFGVSFILFSKEYKRLGDFAAGTWVVKEAPATAPPAAEQAVWQPPYTLLGDAALRGLSRLTDEEYAAAKRFVERRGELDATLAARLAKDIALPILATLGVDPREVAPHFANFLQELVSAYEARRR